MEVIEKGLDLQNWHLDIRCENNLKMGCNSLLRVFVKDIKLSEGQRHYLFYVNCPNCLERVYIKDDMLPRPVKNWIIKHQMANERSL